MGKKPEQQKTKESKATSSGNSSAGKKAVRYAKVSGTMAGLAARVAGERYLGLNIEREKHAQELMLALGG